MDRRERMAMKQFEVGDLVRVTIRKASEHKGEYGVVIDILRGFNPDDGQKVMLSLESGIRIGIYSSMLVADVRNKEKGFKDVS